MASVFKGFSEETKGGSSSCSTSGNSTSVEEESANSESSDGNDRQITKGRKKQSQGKKNKSETLKSNKDDSTRANVKVTSPTTVTYLKAEYRILNITTILKEMTQGYNYTPMPFDPLSSSSLESSSSSSSSSNPLSVCIPAIASSSSSPNTTAMSKESWVKTQGDTTGDDNDQVRREIKEEMYKQLCALYDIVKVEPVLEQYVLRELRHLQEYLCHRYPPIMAYLKVLFDEIIECVRGKTRGLSIVSPNPRNKPASSQLLSLPSPTAMDFPLRSSPQDDDCTAIAITDTNNSRGTRERSTTSSSISSMPPKKQNKSNTVGDLSTSSSGLDSSEDDKNGPYDEI